MIFSELVGRICFSNKPFRMVKGFFFHRLVLWTVGGTLAVGLPLAVIGTSLEQTNLLVIGLLLSIPFQLWVATLGMVSLILATPRLMVLSVALLAFYLGIPGICKWIAEWAKKHVD